MTYLGLESLNDTSLTSLLQFPSIATPLFWPLILFAIFVVMTLSSYFSEKERKGEGNILSSLAVAGYVNIAFSLLFSLMQLIDRINLIISVVISFVFIAIYMLTDK